MTYSMLLVQRNGMPDNAERFLYTHAKQYGFEREQVKVYRYYYKPLLIDENNILTGVTDDIHSSHFLYVLDFKNEKDRFLYNLRRNSDNVDLFYEYCDWNTNMVRESWKNSMEELLADGHLGGNRNEST